MKEIENRNSKLATEFIKKNMNIVDLKFDLKFDLNTEVLKENILKNHKHIFVKTCDGTHDKICAVCGIRAKQAFLHLK